MAKIKKILSFIKNYWYIPVLGIFAIIVIIFTRNKNYLNKVVSMYKDSKTQHKEEVKVIEEYHQEVKIKKAENKQKYVETIDKLENDYKMDKKELDFMRKKYIKKVIEDSNDNPEKLSKDFATEFNLHSID